MVEERRFLGKYLVEKNIITEAQLKEAIEESKRTNRRIGEILIRRKYATEEEIAEALSKQLGFPYLDLSTFQIDAETAALIPKETAIRLQAIPVLKVEDSLTVAMTNPLDISAIDELGRLSGGLRITPMLATATGIKNAIENVYKKGVASRAAMPTPPSQTAESQVTQDALIREATQASVVKVVNQLIEDAVRAGASDIHLEPQQNRFDVRYRIDGVLHKIEAPPQRLQRPITSRIKIMANIDIAQSRLPQDGRVQTSILDRDIDLRIATFPTIYGEHLAIRILDKTEGIIKLEELGLQPGDLKRVKEIICKPYGFILITGPTGSGKSTTLYAILNTIHDETKTIITLEAPVEYTIPGIHIHQSQVNVKAGLTFATGLRSIVRLDPDIIMIGEVRDRETADIAIHSSLTGHLVFSTLHTNDAPSCATRLVDIGVEPYLVASSLIGVVAQRLVRILCVKCKKPYKPTQQEQSIFGRPLKTGTQFYEAVGCKECRNIGYRGRVGIFEVLIPSNEIKELIVKKAPAYEIKKAAQKAGMKTLQEDGLAKVEQGITSLSEVLRVTEEI